MKIALTFMMLFLYNVVAGNVRFTEKSLILHPYSLLCAYALYFIGTAALTDSLGEFSIYIFFAVHRNISLNIIRG